MVKARSVETILESRQGHMKRDPPSMVRSCLYSERDRVIGFVLSQLLICLKFIKGPSGSEQSQQYWLKEQILETFALAIGQEVLAWTRAKAGEKTRGQT